MSPLKTKPLSSRPFRAMLIGIPIKYNKTKDPQESVLQRLNPMYVMNIIKESPDWGGEERLFS